MSGLFRCAGDILFDDHQPLPGQISNVQLKKFSETSNFLQLKQPLTPEHPYFFGQIRALAAQSTITLGIAGPDIDNDAHPGHWNNTVGYHSNTGQCITSHADNANTRGEKFSVGDMFGVLVSYFGDNMSVVMFLKNSIPVATRYLFEPDHSKFLPTICLENGPIDLGVMWPQAAIVIPKFDEKSMQNWIKFQGIQYEPSKNVFFYDKVLPEVTLQSPTPLTKDLVHYEVVVEESLDGESPAVGIATCSPLLPSPTCLLLRDFFRWKADGKDLMCKVGQRIGFGIHYNPEDSCRPDFDDRKQQLVLCFVTVDMQIVFFRMMLQPPGGFYPLVILTQGASKIQLDVETNRDLGSDSTRELLDNLFKEKLSDANLVIEEDSHRRALNKSMFRSSPDLEISIQDPGCFVTLPASKKKIHAVQFSHHLDLDTCYFCAEIVKMNEDSVVSIGIGSSKINLNKHVGKQAFSTGYVSRDGKMYYDDTNNNADSVGERFGEGDTVGVQLLHYDDRGTSVVLLLRNNCPVGTRFVTIPQIEEYYPTISLCGNGYDVVLNVYWQNRISQGPALRTTNLRHWCLPPDSIVDEDKRMVNVKPHNKPVYLQCACPLNDSFNHFEIRIIDEFGGDKAGAPPMIALTAACPKKYDREDMSNFRIDYLRFWAVGEAEKAVSMGDLVGWGMLVPPSQAKLDERLVICYLTINRNIALTRVLFEPPGGLFPVIVLPADLDRVQFEFSACRITSHPITDEIVDRLLNEALDIYAKEREIIASGKDIDDLDIDKSSLLQPLPKASSENGSDSTPPDPKLHNVVVKATGINKIQRALDTHRQKYDNSNNSKACVIL